MNKVVVISLNKKFKEQAKEARKTLLAALRKLKRDGLYTEIYLVDNPTMEKINKISRKKNKVTNVLSFPSKSFPRPDTPLKPIGEIYLAPDFIRVKKQNLQKLAVHGLLHLLGYTHQRKSDRMKMEKLESWLN